MHMHVENKQLEVVTSRSEIAETVGICILAAASVMLAGSVLGLALIISVVGAAFLIHSATRYA